MFAPDEKAAERDASGPEGSHEKSWTYDMLRKGHLLGQRVGYEKGYAEGVKESYYTRLALDEQNSYMEMVLAERDAAQAETAALREEVERLREVMRIADCYIDFTHHDWCTHDCVPARYVCNCGSSEARKQFDEALASTERGGEESR